MRRRRRLAIGIVAACLLGIGVIAIQRVDLRRAPQRWQQYAFDDLSFSKVQEIFRNDSAGFLVSIPDLGWDTVRSVAEYQRIAELVALVRQIQPDSMSFDRAVYYTEDIVSTTPEASLGTYAIDVEGERRAGRELVFSIENFDPSVRYMIDFGNGVHRRVSHQTRYTYPLPGNFILKLIATSTDRGSSVYSKRFVIAEDANLNNIAAGGRQRQDISASAVGLPPLNEPTEIAVPRSQDTAFTRQLTIIDLRDDATQPPLAPESTQPSDSKIALRTEKPLVYTEIMPEFPGGQSALRRYLTKKLTYPLKALENNIEGRVVVQFIVNADGSLSDFRVLQGIGHGCDEEALRVVRNMPNWKPGEHNGKKMPVYQSVPIIFRVL
ncbi:MAG: hypothetical protein OHK0039_41410 [Bacteroidia bacterium]